MSQDGQNGSLRQPAASGDKSLTLKQIAGRTAAGLGVTATIVSAAVYLFRARLFEGSVLLVAVLTRGLCDAEEW